MRIAIVTTSYPSKPGDPSGHFVEAEARSLAARGHQVFVLSPFACDSNGPGLTHVQVRGAPLFGWPGALDRAKAAPWLLPQAVAFAVSVQRALHHLRPLNRVIAHWIVPSAWPAALGPWPLQVVVHGSDLRLLARLPYRMAALVVGALARREVSFRCVSAALERQLLELCPALTGRTSVRPCSIDLTAAPSREVARAGLQLGDERLVVIVGRLIESKRVALALRATGLLPNVLVAVVGDGPELISLKGKCPEVRFLGKQSRPETLRWIAAADILVSASLQEGAPTAVREAIALGVDVVACPAGDLQSWARDEPLLWLTAERPQRN